MRKCMQASMGQDMLHVFHVYICIYIYINIDSEHLSACFAQMGAKTFLVCWKVALDQNPCVKSTNPVHVHGA